MKNLLTILLFILVVQSNGQTIIKGTIIDQKGNTIPGVIYLSKTAMMELALIWKEHIFLKLMKSVIKSQSFNL